MLICSLPTEKALEWVTTTSHLRCIPSTFPECFQTSSRGEECGWSTFNSLSREKTGRWVRPVLPNPRTSDYIGRDHAKALFSEGIEFKASVRAGLPGWGKEFEWVHWTRYPNWQSDPLSTLYSSHTLFHSWNHRSRPMQLGFTHLTSEEREPRMQNQLCLYCGQAGHMKISCPVCPSSSSQPVSVNTHFTTSA